MISETLNNGQTSTATSYTYDANGNLASKTANNVTTTYTFDVWGNMTSAAGATYTYNVQGLRIAKTIGNKTNHFCLVNGRILSINTYEYYLLGNEIVGNGSTYYLYNAHGDVIQLLNSSGTVTKTYDYDAYGNELTRDLNDSNPFRYCGEYYDTETGFIYLRTRYYNPSTGRFISVDPIKDGLNWYAYCNNNPVSYVDPNGESAILAAILKAGIGGSTDLLAQLTCNYFFNPETKFDISASFEAVNWWQVARSSVEAALPWNVPGGKWGKAAFSAAGDVLVNLLTYGEDYNIERALMDFATGFLGSLAASEIQELIGSFSNKASIDAQDDAITIAGKGSTGRTEPNDLLDDIAMQNVLADPLCDAQPFDGSISKSMDIKLSDPRWLAEDGWVKFQRVFKCSNSKNRVIHFVYNTITKEFDDFKFKD